jgi:hypothetical protein
MRLTKTTVAVEITVLLIIVVVVEWLEPVLTVGVYLSVRAAISARKRRAGEIRDSN